MTSFSIGTQINCPHCNYTGIPDFAYHGPHLGMCCDKCRKLLASPAAHLLPNLLELRAAIWEYAGQNKERVEACKQLCGFMPGFTGSMNVYQHWKIYKQLIVESSI